MIKSVFMLCTPDLPNELPAFERWLLRYHTMGVMSKDAGLQVRFLGYQPIPAIQEILTYGYYNLRVIEVWFRSVVELEELEPLQRVVGTIDRVLSFTWQAPWATKPINLKEVKPYVPPRVAFSVYTPSKSYVGS